MGEKRNNAYRGFEWKKIKTGDHLENLDIDGSIILKGILKGLNVLFWLRGETSDGIL